MVVPSRIELEYQVPETCVLSIVLRDQTYHPNLCVLSPSDWRQPGGHCTTGPNLSSKPLRTIPVRLASAGRTLYYGTKLIIQAFAYYPRPTGVSRADIVLRDQTYHPNLCILSPSDWRQPGGHCTTRPIGQNYRKKFWNRSGIQLQLRFP